MLEANSDSGFKVEVVGGVVVRTPLEVRSIFIFLYFTDELYSQFGSLLAAEKKMMLELKWTVMLPAGCGEWKQFG